MNTQFLGLLLPIVIFFHGAEEYASFDEFKKTSPFFIDKRFHHRQVFLYALLIIQAIVTLVGVWYYLTGSITLDLMTTIVVLAFLINGFQHVCSSLWHRKVLPGTISSILLIIPFGIGYLVILEKEMHYGIVSIFFLSVISLVLTFLLIHSALLIGYFLYTFLSDR